MLVHVRLWGLEDLDFCDLEMCIKNSGAKQALQNDSYIYASKSKLLQAIHPVICLALSLGTQCGKCSGLQ